MPYYGNITDPSRPVLEEIERVLKTGFDYVEISFEGPEGSPEKLLAQQKEIHELIRDRGGFATGHMAWWAELGSAYESVRKAWIREVKDAITVARAIQITKLNVHSHVRGLYLSHKIARRESIQHYIESLEELVKFASENGIMLMLENSASRRDISKYDDFQEIVEAIPEIGVHIDIAHAYLHGGLIHVDQCLKGFRKRIIHLHVSDNQGKDDDHLPIGRGKINFERAVKTLKRIRYDGTITFEIFRQKKEGIPHSLSTFKRLWAKV